MTAAFLFLCGSPIAIVGAIALVKPEALVRLMGRWAKWNERVFGMKSATAPILRKLYTPVHRRLLGDIDTVNDKMVNSPKEFRALNNVLRAGGVWALLLSLGVITAGAAELLG